jgi:virulence factor Mce-like protein
VTRRARVAAILVVALVAAVAVVFWPTSEPTRLVVAHFTRTVGIHPGSDVRVLGVRVGEVVAVTPQGRTVRVELRYAARHPVPANATAVIVPPSVVSDRYIQLTPAYTSGPTLPDGAELPVGRTAVPLELDVIYRSLDELNTALGPGGVNADGVLSDLAGTARRNLEGNGQQLHDTLAGLSQALSTVAEGRQDLFGTVANLQELTTALARSDAVVRDLNRQLAAVGEQLAAERTLLAAALRNLATALADITTFVHENRAALADNVTALADISTVLVRQQRALIDVLDVAPLALSNLNLAYNPRSGTLDTRNNALGPYDAASYVCSVLATALPVAQVPKECDELRRLVGLPPGSPTPGQPGTLPSVPVLPGLLGGPDQSSRDLTLGGILRGPP